MTDLFDNKYLPGRILIQTVGSGGPGNSWVSAIATKQIKGKVEVWYNPDFTQEYEDDSEPFILGSIKGEHDPRSIVSFLNSNKPEGFYFDEITIQGIKGIWKDLIIISLSDEYSEVLEQLLTLNDNDLKKFNKKEGPFVENDILEIDKLDQINEILFERLDETGKSNLTLSQLLNHSDLNTKFSLKSVEEQIEIWEEQEEVRLKIAHSKEEKRRQELKSKYQGEIEFALKNHKSFSNFESDDEKVEEFLDSYIFEHGKLPSKKCFYFSVGVWIRRRSERFFESQKVVNWVYPNKGEVQSDAYIDFKALFHDYKEKLK